MATPRNKKSGSHIRIEKEYRYPKKVRIWTIVGSSAMTVLGVLCIVAAIVISSVLGRINFSDDDTVYDPNAMLGFEEEEEESDIQGEHADQEEYDKALSVLELPLRGNEKGVRNILLLGIDSTSFSGRSDTTMILSINDNAKSIKLISLQRDTWVSLPGRDTNKDGKDDICKLNEAYAYGRHTLQNKMLNQNFRLDIDQYIGVNFQVLPILIDAMGGLDIELSASEMTQIPEKGCKIPVGHDGFIQLSGAPGVHHLDGYQITEYARIRKIDSDFNRTARQRTVVSKVIEKAKTMSYAELISMVYQALSYVDTNMSADELLGFAANSLKYTSYAVNMDYSVPRAGEYKGTYIGKKAGLLLTDPKKTVQDLHQYIYG